MTIAHTALTALTLLLAVFTTLRTLRPDNAVSYPTDRKNADAVLCAVFWMAFYLLTNT